MGTYSLSITMDLSRQYGIHAHTVAYILEGTLRFGRWNISLALTLVLMHLFLAWSQGDTISHWSEAWRIDSARCR